MEGITLDITQEESQSTINVFLFLRMINSNHFTLPICIDIGKALFHETNGSYKGLEQWKNYIEFLSDDFTLTEICELKYFTFNKSTITHKTIAWYAKEKSSQDYKKWHKKWIDESFHKCLEVPSVENLTEMFYRKYWLNFVYSNHKTYYYQDDGHHWKLLYDGKLSIRNFLINEILIEFENKEKYFSQSNIKQNIINNDGEEKLLFLLNNIKKIKNIIYKNTSIINNIQDKFRFENFENILDKNFQLVGVKNGVLEIDSSSIQFRYGKPEDYLINHISIPYREELNIEHDCVKKYLKYLEQVFPNKELMEHMKLDIASFLRYNNDENLIRIIYGKTDSSKSVFIKIIQRAFGYCCGNFSFSQTKKKRISYEKYHILTFCDLDINQKFDPSVFWEMSQKTKLLLVVDKMDQMIKNIENTFKCGRIIKIIPFLSNFVDKYPESEEQQYEFKQFPKNTDYLQNETIFYLSEAMLWCAVQDYSLYCRIGLRNPPNLIREIY